jgi:hypothetical protein
MKTGHHFVIGSSTLVAGAIAVALLLRPSHSIKPGPELAAPERLSPMIRGVVHSKMTRHGEQLTELVSRVVLLDYDGIARVAGAIYDEPSLARPTAGDQLNGALPERFFAYQDALRTEAKALVEIAARHDRVRLADSFTAVTKTCLQCHDLYLYGE